MDHARRTITHAHAIKDTPYTYCFYNGMICRGDNYNRYFNFFFSRYIYHS